MKKKLGYKQKYSGYPNNFMDVIYRYKVVKKPKVIKYNNEIFCSLFFFIKSSNS